jgi:hypothetical protein
VVVARAENIVAVIVAAVVIWWRLVIGEANNVGSEDEKGVTEGVDKWEGRKGRKRGQKAEAGLWTIVRLAPYYYGVIVL